MSAIKLRPNFLLHHIVTRRFAQLFKQIPILRGHLESLRADLLHLAHLKLFGEVLQCIVFHLDFGFPGDHVAHRFDDHAF